ncbi:MAG: oligosaccharide flippase family protein [Anaerolineae bacterium]|nr:oligosaccharide flippase family protein [Anaerolineae bacterium]
MEKLKRLGPDLLVAFSLLLPLIILFWPVTFGGKTLIPVDNLFTFEPWKSFARDVGVSVPHNELLSDLILENYVWKKFILECIQNEELPLWNPYIFTGMPFLATGQHSALYPFSLIFYIVPLPRAYGLFTLIQLWIAGLSMYFLARVLGMSRFGSVTASLAYELSGFFVVSVVFPMIIAAASWLPAILACIEITLRRLQEGQKSPVPFVILGSLFIGLHFLAGHPEISYYVAMVAAYFALVRVLTFYFRQRQPSFLLKSILALGTMAITGAGLGAVQLIPLYEVARLNFRQGMVTLKDVLGWAYPIRQVITFLIPDFFGNPSHHAYFDLVTKKWLPVTVNYRGEPINFIFWGIKNYVEAGSYMGLLTLCLALAGILLGKDRGIKWTFSALAVLSLLFAFGTPLYALLYYFLPGYNQLHSPFRWVFPYTLSVAVLAGIGVEERGKLKPLFPLALTILGLLGLLFCLVSFLYPEPFFALADRFLAHSDLAQGAFSDGRMFFSYEWWNFLRFSIFLTLAGAALTIAGRERLKAFIPAIIAADLLWAWWGFNPASDPTLLQFTPPVVNFLKSDPELYRITSFNLPGEKTFWPNVGMLFGIHDVRGYDSIILKQYARFMELLSPQWDLLYNRISPIYTPFREALNSPLLDLLNVKYIITTQEINNPGYTLVYEGEVRVYRNEDYLPRAFVSSCALTVEETELPHVLQKMTSPKCVVLEKGPKPWQYSPEDPPLPEASGEIEKAQIVSYSPTEVVVSATLKERGLLVLTDAFFPGWKAHDGKKELKLFRAYGNFRAVILDSGTHLVRFKYSPMSLKLGLYTSFIASSALLFLFLYWLWHRIYREKDETTLSRVAKNTFIPMGLAFANKLIDMAFAMLMLRILAPEGAGRYQFAVIFIGYFEILTRFGLGVLLTREVAKDKSQANRYITNVTLLRILLWLSSWPLMAFILFLYVRYAGLTMDTAFTVGLFSLALLLSLLSDVISSVFMAWEKMEYPAWITTVTTLMRVTLGAIALLAGFGYVGLAGVSVVVNAITLAILFYLMVNKLFTPRPEPDLSLVKGLLRPAFPLMINHFLATVFFRIDILILQPLKGDATVGYYTAAYRYIDGLNIIPSYFTMALFPMLSRYAESYKEEFMRVYNTALRLLILVSMPISVLFTFTARELILLLGGSEYLPHSMIALQLLIWFFPFSCINSVTQYVLIAINQQSFLTKAFLIGVAFNIIGNLIFIPPYSYKGASVMTVLSELALFAPFYYCVRKNLGPLPLKELLWRPALASGLMALTFWAVQKVNLVLAITASMVVYLSVVVALGAFTREEIERVIGGLRRRLARG